MKQVLQDRNSGQIRVVDVPAPAVLAGGVRLVTRASVISTGTERSTVRLGEKSLLGKARARPDLARKVLNSVRSKGLLETARTVRARLAEPSVLGYSAAGLVTDVGSGVEGFAPGDRVACAGQGVASHAEVTFAPRNLVVHLPDAVSFEDGAFVALGAIGLHGVRTAGVEVGDHVVVIGLGLVGLLTVQLLRAAGCVVYGLDLQRPRADLARHLGCDHAVMEPDELSALLETGTAGQGADAVLLTASTPSNQPVRLAGELARDRGMVCVVGDVGLEVPRETYYMKELSFRISRSYGPGRYDPAYELLGHSYPPGFVPWDQRRNMEAVLDLIARGALQVKPLATAKHPIDDAPEAYRRIAAERTHEPSPIAIVLTYDGAPEELAAPLVGVRTTRRRQSVRHRGIAFIGAGHFARATLLPRFAKASDFRRVVVVTTSGPSAHAAAESFQFEQAGTSADAALEDPNVNVVVIATRHNSHAELVIRALRAGHTVFVEKPLAITLPQLIDVSTAANESGNDRVMVGFNRRFSAFARALRSHFPGGAQAMMYRVNAGFLPPSHWTRDRDIGGGRLIGEGCHFVDLMSSVADSQVVEVHAHGIMPADGGSPDTVQVNFLFANGAIGHLLYLGVGDPQLPKEHLQVFGHGRAAVLDNFQRLELWKGGKRKERKARARVDKGFDREVELFLDACRTGGPMPIPISALVNTTLATLAVERSLTERRSVRIADLAGALH